MFVYKKLLQMFIESYFFSRKQLFTMVPLLVEEAFNIEEGIVKKELSSITSIFKDDIIFYLEYPYVEKYYRDTYYHFFSKKHVAPQRDSIRISIFSSELNDKLFYSNSDDSEIEKYFYGYFTLRPTTYRIIGHTFISPLALINNKFSVCLTRKNALVGGRKLNVTGFPFSAQDNEFITCAESTIINLFDYFGNKYSDYKTILPSQVLKVLTHHSTQRQLPSEGLPTSNISYLLKKLGFGSLVYSKVDSKTPSKILDRDKFRDLLFTYIESGIPLIGILSSKNYQHAVLVIGREVLADKHYFKRNLFAGQGQRHRFSSAFEKVLIMDDNNPPYRLVNYKNPEIEVGENYEFVGFVVPLHPKVHLEGYQFEAVFYKLLDSLGKYRKTKNISFINDKKDSIIRFFLASSRSYKNHIKSSNGISEDLKGLILSISMPKFIWIAEVIEGQEYANNSVVSSVVAVDATESGNGNKLIFATNCSYIVVPPFSLPDEDLEESIEYENSTSFQVFNFVNNKEIFYTFVNNLKGVHTQWRS